MLCIFHSVLSYGFFLFGNSTSRIKDILILQKKAIRTMNKLNRRINCKPQLVYFNIITVINLYLYNVVKFTVKSYFTYLRHDVHSYNTRNNRAIDYKYYSLTINKSLSSHFSVGLKVYNMIRHGYCTSQTFID